MSSPLGRRRVLVTRTREQASGIVDALYALGAEAVVVPLIATEPLASPDQVTAAFERLGAAAPPRWLALTSGTAARLVLGVVTGQPRSDVQVAAIGAETATPLTQHGWTPDLVAHAGSAEALAQDMVSRGVRGGHVWFPAAEGAGDALPRVLREAGAQVEVQPVYRTVMPGDAPRRLRAALDRGIDAVMLTSGSTARNLVSALAGPALPDSIVIACIGEQTAREARAAGLRVDVVAPQASVSALADALARHWSGETVG